MRRTVITEIFDKLKRVLKFGGYHSVSTSPKTFVFGSGILMTFC